MILDTSILPKKAGPDFLSNLLAPQTWPSPRFDDPIGPYLALPVWVPNKEETYLCRVGLSSQVTRNGSSWSIPAASVRGHQW